MERAELEDLFLAGHPAPPGRYRRVGAPDGRVVVLRRRDVLPASLDGHVAAYERCATLAFRAAAPSAGRGRRVPATA